MLAGENDPFSPLASASPRLQVRQAQSDRPW